MSRKPPPPVITRIPAEVHADAAALGLTAEIYTETIAGHGHTGHVAWALSAVTVAAGWTDAVRIRYGTSLNAGHAVLDLRHAIDQVRAQRAEQSPELKPREIIERVLDMESLGSWEQRMETAILIARGDVKL